MSISIEWCAVGALILFCIVDVALYFWAWDWAYPRWWRKLPGSGFYATLRRLSAREEA